jgi:hypothetical protein
MLPAESSEEYELFRLDPEDILPVLKRSEDRGGGIRIVSPKLVKD